MFMSEKEASEYLGVSIHYLRAQRYKRPKNMISYYKVGRRVLYHRDDLQQYMSSKKIRSAI